jgi:SNF2 family DNA or RNA helicase
LITQNHASFVVNGLGTGKTRTPLYAFDYLNQCGLRNRLLVTAPLSTIRQTWCKEVMMIFPHLKAVALHGSKEKRLKLLAQDADIYVINHDGVEVIFHELMARAVPGDIDMLCLDELGVYKSAQTDLWKFTNKLARKIPHITGMNGTPMPNGPEDAYGQIKIISPANVPSSFTRYREKVSFKAGPYKWLPREGSTDAVHKMMQPSVRFTRDECFDIPDAQTIQRVGPLSATQQRLYNEVAKQCTAEVQAGTIKAFNEADRINKLVQISLGCVYTTDRDVQTLDCKDRLTELERCIQDSQSKVIVFTPYKHTLAMLALVLKQRWSVETVSGDTPNGMREFIFTNFMHNPDPHVIVAHPACMSHGLTLTAASTIIWYGPPNSLETYEQANARISRPGQQFKQLIINLAGTKLEEKIYARLNSRAQLQGVLLDLFESQELGDLL